MTVIHFAALYAAIGAAIAFAARHRSSLLDAALLVGLWPMYGPLVALAADTRERELLAALRRAAATPLGAILPDQASARALARRLRDASARLRAIDGVLARPDFDLGAARAQVVELTARAATACAIGTAELRVQTIERVHTLRQRFAGDLDEVDQLIAQLVAQAELVRFAGVEGSTDLVRELVARVEGLDQLMAAEVGGDLDSTGGAPNPGGR